ncbi:MAG: hypothetical protein WDZ51_07045 [Pirellulaceae bacterium]
MTHSIWTSDYEVAHRATTPGFKLASLATNQGDAVFKFQTPSDHLEACRIDLRELGTRTEYYIRGADLVQRYQEDTQKLSTEIYARVCEEESSCELVLSRQTDLLETHPEANLRVDFPTAYSVALLEAEGPWSPPGLGAEDHSERLPSQPAALAVKVTDGSCFGVFVYPGDFSRFRAIRKGFEHVTLEIGIFPEPLEKGVIRRSRIQIAAIGPDEDKAALAEAYQRFVASAIPLTT